MAAMELKDFDFDMLIGEGDAHDFTGGPHYYSPELNDRIYWATLQDVKEAQFAQQ